MTPKDAEDLLRKALGGYTGNFGVAASPCFGWDFRPTQKLPKALPPGLESVIPLAFDSETDLKSFREVFEQFVKPGGPGIVKWPRRMGADLSISGTDYFCPANIDQLLFGDRYGARLLTGSEHLRTKGLAGTGVNVVVVDTGIDRTQIANFGGGWVPPGGPAPGSLHFGHGPMMVRNILDAAPQATLYDVPLIPLRIDDVDAFIYMALCVMLGVISDIVFLKQFEPWSGPWVLVNAWAVYDRSSEVPLGDYTADITHPFNVLTGFAVGQGIDVVFAAGNCGQFYPDNRCGVCDRGPGSSIYGANSHPQVITTGAVRTDVRWLGTSSQGPGAIDPCKPDLCAPSNFREDQNAFTGNTAEPYVGLTGSPFIASTGTSAACGVTAGIVAALRSNPQWDPATVSPSQMKQVLMNTARKTEALGRNDHLGYGIINARAAFGELSRRFP
ncbi:MAG: S8 family serine peptidase [Hyphomicrobiales bacterium]